MRFTIFQESRKGAREVNQDRIAYTYSRDTLLLVVADGMGGHVGGEIAAQIAVRLFIERFQQEAKPILAQSAASSCRRRCCARTRRSARTQTSSRCSRRRARRALPSSCRAATRTGRTSATRGFYLLRQGKLIGVDEGSLEGAVPRRPGHHRAAGRRARIPTATRSSAAWAARPIR